MGGITGDQPALFYCMKVLSKKAYKKKRANSKEKGHWEGKYWCDCKTGKYRLWLGVKRYGHQDDNLINL